MGRRRTQTCTFVSRSDGFCSEAALDGLRDNCANDSRDLRLSKVGVATARNRSDARLEVEDDGVVAVEEGDM